METAISTFKFVENFKKLGFDVSNEMQDYSYPGDEPELDGLVKTEEQITRDTHEALKSLYPYPGYHVYLFNGVKSVVLYHNIDTMTIRKSIFDLDSALSFVKEYKIVAEAQQKRQEEERKLREKFNENMPKKPANSLEYGTKKELALLRKNVGLYYDSLNHLLTENVIKILGNNSVAGWKNLGKTTPPHERVAVERVKETLKYIEELAVYKEKN